jgi:chitinase
VTPGFGSGVADVSTSWNHTLVVMSDGRIFGCGYNQDGQLGNGAGGVTPGVGAHSSLSPDPVLFFGAGSTVSAIDNGFAHTVVIGQPSGTPSSTAAVPTTTPQTTTPPITFPPGYTPPEVNIGDVEIDQGDTGTRTATITITLSHPSPFPVKVTVRSKPDPDAGQDYGPVLKTVSFPANTTVKTIPVQVFGSATNDEEVEAQLEIVKVLNAVAKKSIGTVTIEPDLDTPVVDASVADVTVVEGDAGLNKASFTISLNRPASTTVTVSYKTADGDAQAGSDFSARSGKVSFKPGQVSKPVVVTVRPDAGGEGNEEFQLKLTAATNARLDETVGVGTIQYDD